MRIGLSLPHYGFSLPEGVPLTAEACLGWAERAESLRFDSVWVSDHLVYSFGRYGADPAPIASLEPLTLLAAIAARTERVRLGTLVLCAPFRHPGVLAKQVATIDRLSAGRLDLGLGAGWLQAEFEAFGIAFGSIGERFAALENAVRALRSPAPLPTVQQPLPIWVGGKGGPRLLRLAARYGAGWNTVWRMSPGAYTAKSGDVEAACEAEGRDPTSFRRSLGLYGLIGETEEAAAATFERARDAFPGGAMVADTWDGWKADTLSGSAEQVLARLQDFADLGVDELIWSPWVLPFAIPEPEQVERFAADVLAPWRAARR